ncbi:MAG: DUF2723 domain-containing protein [Anaerolineales bacterium]|nr:DUF2723 domain-containing protein [Anaerolineales bacterium]
MAQIEATQHRSDLKSFALNWLPFIILVLAGGFYLITLQPALAWGDGARIQIEAITGESFIFTGLPDEMFTGGPFPFAKLGVAAWDHPLYVYFGYGLVRMLSFANPLWMINFISALFGALTITLFYVLCLKHTNSVGAALLAAFSLAVSHTYWFHAASPEVYTFLTFLMLACLYFYDRFEETGKFSYLFASVLVFGMAAATHVLAFLMLPAFGLFCVIRFFKGERERPAANQLLLLPLAFVLGFAPYLIQFLRMLGVFNPTDVAESVIGIIFLESSLGITLGFVLESIGMYFFYLLLQFNPLGAGIGFYGLWKSRDGFWRRNLFLYIVYALFGTIYRVTDQFAFLMLAHMFFALAIAKGVAVLLPKLHGNRRRNFVFANAVLIVAMPVLYTFLPSITAKAGITDETLGIPSVGVEDVRSGITYYANPNKYGDTSADEFGRSTISALPLDAFVVAEWYTDTDEYLVFDYYARVAGLRPDVEVAGWMLEDPFTFDSQIVVDEIEAQLAERPVYLASLSEEFYNASYLMREYCIVPEFNIYRVYAQEPTHDAAAVSCLSAP